MNKPAKRTLVLMLNDLRDLWSVSICDTAMGWQLTLSTIAENGDLEEYRYADTHFYDVVQKAWGRHI